MDAIDAQFNAGDSRAEELAEWKRNNPEGFQRELDEQRKEYLHAVDAVRHEQGDPPLTAQQRADYHTPEDPHEIEKMHGALTQGLSEEGREWLDNQRLVADNLGLVACMQEIDNEEFKNSAALDDAITGTKIMCDRYGVDPADVAERYEIEVSPETLDKIAGAMDVEANTVEQKIDPPEHVASIEAPSVGGPAMGGMG